MKAGRELDALIAEKVMGFDVDAANIDDAREYCWNHNTRECFRIPYYSQDIASAWQVVEKLGDEWIFLRLSNISGRGRWRCASNDGEITDFADTAPHAICLAALKAMEER